MADFPSGVYDPRTKENKAGEVYDEDLKTRLFAEDISYLDAEVVALETFLSPKLLTLRPTINIDEIKKQAVPVQVQRGVFFGYSLPIYDADHQEVYCNQRVPYRWDGSSNIRVNIHILLSGAEDVGDKFNFQLSWEHMPCDIVAPDTSNDVPIETTVLIDRNEAYDEYCVTFTIDYDIDGEGNEIKVDELLGMRLRRIAATESEVTNEIILLGFDVEYQRDKFGGAF